MLFTVVQCNRIDINLISTDIVKCLVLCNVSYNENKLYNDWSNCATCIDANSIKHELRNKLIKKYNIM